MPEREFFPPMPPRRAIPPDYVPDREKLVTQSTPDLQSRQMVSPNSQETAQPQTPEKKTEKLVGRVSYAPRFDILASGSPRARFSIASHTEDGETIYSTVYSTKVFAARIERTGMEKGHLVEVAGRWQTTTEKGKEVRKFYAYGVRILGATDGNTERGEPR